MLSSELQRENSINKSVSPAIRFWTSVISDKSSVENSPVATVVGCAESTINVGDRTGAADGTRADGAPSKLISNKDELPRVAFVRSVTEVEGIMDGLTLGVIDSVVLGTTDGKCEGNSDGSAEGIVVALISLGVTVVTFERVGVLLKPIERIVLCFIVGV